MKEKDLKKSISEIQTSLDRLKRDRLQTRLTKPFLSSPLQKDHQSIKPDHQSSKRKNLQTHFQDWSQTGWKVRDDQLDKFREENTYLNEKRADLQRQVASLTSKISEMENLKHVEEHKNTEKELFNKEVMSILTKQSHRYFSEDKAIQYLEERFKLHSDFEEVKKLLKVEEDEEVSVAIQMLQRKNEAMLEIVRKATKALGLQSELQRFERAEKRALE